MGQLILQAPHLGPHWDLFKGKPACACASRCTSYSYSLACILPLRYRGTVGKTSLLHFWLQSEFANKFIPHQPRTVPQATEGHDSSQLLKRTKFHYSSYPSFNFFLLCSPFLDMIQGSCLTLTSDEADFLLSKFNELKWHKMIPHPCHHIQKLSKPPLAVASRNEVAGSLGEGEKKSEPSPFSSELWCLFTAPCKTTHLNRLFFKY